MVGPAVKVEVGAEGIERAVAIQVEPHRRLVGKAREPRDQAALRFVDLGGELEARGLRHEAEA